MPTIDGQSGEYDFTADDITLSVTATGVIAGQYGVVMGSHDSDRIDNYGTISGTKNAILLGGTHGFLENHGTLYATYAGLLAGLFREPSSTAARSQAMTA